MRRRDLILAGLGLAALGTAEALRPRNRLVLLKKGATIEAAIPAKFGAWEAQATSGLVGPEMAGRLAKTLYSESVARNYFDAASGAQVMLLAAYGDTQSDLLQLHRPESCYPAVGFTIRSSRAFNLPLATGATLPVRKVVAEAEGRVENIVYWTRMGEKLPQSGGQQREARLSNAIQGYVPDGILVRCSILGEPEPSFRVLDAFVPAMLQSMSRTLRPALIGTRLTQQMTA